MTDNKLHYGSPEFNKVRQGIYDMETEILEINDEYAAYKAKSRISKAITAAISLIVGLALGRWA